MTFNKIKIAKSVISLVVGVGTTKIVTSVISNNVPMDSLISKVTVIAAGIVLGGMAADFSKNYVVNQVDKMIKYWEEEIEPSFPA